MALAAIDTFTPYRDPRTAFGNGDRISKLRQAVSAIPVGEATDLTGKVALQDIGAMSEPAKPVVAQAAPGRAAATAGRATGAVNAVLDADVGATAANAAKATGGAAAGTVRSLAGTLTRGIGRLAAPVALGAQAYETANTDTADYYKRTGIDQDASVVPQVVKDVGVRALGTLQDIGNTATFGAADRLGNLIAGKGFVRSDQYQSPAPDISVIPSAQAQTAQPQAAVASAADMATKRGAARDAVGTQDIGTPANPAGIITRIGNSYTGGPDIKAGAEIVNARNPRAGVTVQPGGGGFGPGSGVLADDALSSARSAAAARGDFDAVAGSYGRPPATQPGLIGIGGSGSTTILDDLRAKTIADRRLPANAGRQEVARAMQQDQLAQQRENSAQQIAAQARGQDIGLAGQRLAASTQTRGQDIGAATSRYSADESAAARRDVAQESAAARVDAAKERTATPKVVGGGQVPFTDPLTGETKLIMQPQRLVHPVTGEEIGAKPAAPESKYTKGQTYTDAKGNKATWDGTKFVPAK